MIVEKGILPPSKERDDLDKREQDFKVATALNFGESGVFETNNIKAWRQAFSSYLKKNEIEGKFSIKHFMQRVGDKEVLKYRIWRLR